MSCAWSGLSPKRETISALRSKTQLLRRVGLAKSHTILTLSSKDVQTTGVIGVRKGPARTKFRLIYTPAHGPQSPYLVGRTCFLDFPGSERTTCEYT